MGLADDIKANAKDTFSTHWSVRDGQKVPSAKDVALGNDAVKFERATVLYADLDQSTALVENHHWYFAAEVYKSFLYAATRLANNAGGTVVGYDGDRVMVVFIGSSQCNDALRCAFKINYAVKNLLQPQLEAYYKSSTFKIRHTVGLDTGLVRTVRSGARGDNDLVWIGNSANLAAKLTAESADHGTWITNRVYEKLNDDNKYGISNGVKVSMWKEFSWTKHNKDKIWASSWWRGI
ncbi:adenylate/guanylate cyclase domain-containing protein [Devosia sp. RR2S18]|uniref:adenylate/guanylate cyclase domain-containing protein n=1 Tax=Devosia rhizosphaerae TaxID=3049774 RepID=UPI002542689B|nr:adenylate/guanylate cyclase domain-containing protein [Devosia sp. RR2S18]WIJ25773.1 adenylate/guanylate cyclase domain-containing protein [Devosia sp. RR2S18]